MKLTDIKTVRDLMNRYNNNFTKSLGQNFLINENIVQKIAQVSGADKNIGVIEIGPGIGTLTQKLCELSEKVVAIEIDAGLIPVLKETLKDYSNCEIINDDVMKINLQKVIDEKLEGLDVIVCANLPYYITSPVIMLLLENKLPIKSITVMIQTEVAKRFCAEAGSADYGAITLAVKYFSEPNILFEVSNNNFIPPPKVSSSVIKFDVLKSPPVKPVNEAFMFRLIKAAFGQRRKTLVNAIQNYGLTTLDKNSLEELLKSLNINEKARGETLSLQSFCKLSNVLYK